MYMYHNFCIYLSVHGHLDCFRVLDTVKSAATNIGVHVSLPVMVFSEYMTSSGIVETYGSSISSVQSLSRVWLFATPWTAATPGLPVHQPTPGVHPNPRPSSQWRHPAISSNQSILKEISPGCSLEGTMLKLKLQYFGPPHAKSWFIGKDSDAGRDWGQEEKGTTEDEMAGW